MTLFFVGGVLLVLFFAVVFLLLYSLFFNHILEKFNTKAEYNLSLKIIVLSVIAFYLIHGARAWLLNFTSFNFILEDGLPYLALLVIPLTILIRAIQTRSRFYVTLILTSLSIILLTATFNINILFDFIFLLFFFLVVFSLPIVVTFFLFYYLLKNKTNISLPKTIDLYIATLILPILLLTLANLTLFNMDNNTPTTEFTNGYTQGIIMLNGGMDFQYK